MYAGCGLNDVAWKNAHELFDEMPQINVMSWNAIMKGYLEVRNPGLVLKLFRKTVRICVRMIPPRLCVRLLTACGSRLGLFPGGKYHLLELSDVFNVKPSFAHYWCIANLYASLCLVHDAVEFLKNMPIHNLSRQSSMRAGLLGSCRFKGNMGIREQIAKALIDDT
ncbi:hypothetical protein L1987_65667 [Smallanthus sonchifolius]|uniref:Uncharacterized protein n=1 Tax=Smallanthus sonchifolius TaxID=185202 RepID=A0ACB9BUZ4_9ASTR|nr:hypothetical protein L1987_65667 [Smallanthus sonchifolius]